MLINEDRGKVKVDLGPPGQVELFFTFGARRKLKAWLEEHRPDEYMGSPTELSLVAYFWAGQLWKAPELKYADVEVMLDGATVTTNAMKEAAANAVSLTTAGKTVDEVLDELKEKRDNLGKVRTVSA